MERYAEFGAGGRHLRHKSLRSSERTRENVLLGLFSPLDSAGWEVVLPVLRDDGIGRQLTMCSQCFRIGIRCPSTGIRHHHQIRILWVRISFRNTACRKFLPNVHRRWWNQVASCTDLWEGNVRLKVESTLSD